MRRALAIAAAALTVATAAHAEAIPPTNLNAIGTTLRTTPLTVTQDTAWMLTPTQRAQLTQQLQRSSVPIRVALMPLETEGETGLEGDLAAQRLAKITGKPGLYVVIDADGELDSFADHVPRELPFDLVAESPPGVPRTLADLELPQRITKLIATVDQAPAGSTTTDTSYQPKLLPATYKGHRLGFIGGPIALALILGAFAGALLAIPFRRAARKGKRKP